MSGRGRKEAQSCSTCNDRMPAGNVVSIDAPRKPDAGKLREFLETARRLKQEHATSGDTVPHLLRSTPPKDWPALAADERLHNNAALERLGQESRDLLEKKPQQALTIAELATTIAEALPDDAYPAAVLAQVRAGAWKDRANALRYVSRLDEAFDAISRAEKTLKSHAALVVDRAVVDLVKALILWQMGNAAESHDILRQAESVFRAVGDTVRVRYSKLIDASVLYNEGRHGEASLVWGSLLGEVAASDAETVARLHNNLGYCATHLGDFVAANIHFSEAIARFTDLGFHAEAMRTQRGAGVLLVEKGRIKEGLSHLRKAREGFAQFGIVRDAGLCGLRIAEALLASGDAEGAREMTHEVSRELTEARFSQEAIAMLADLESALATEDASVEFVRDVHGFIEALPDARVSC